MPFVKANMEEEAKKLQTLMDSDPVVKKHIEEWDEEYEFRKKLAAARRETGLTQKEIGMLSGLNYRAISRVESSSDVSPNLKTVIKYLNALGYKLEIIKVVSQ